ncbi:MAG: AI-2E family transporter [Euzebya sp.]
MLALYTAIQLLDAHILQPWIMGHRLPLHPAAVLVALTAGGVVAGILGALLAVPVTAVIVAATHEYLVDGRHA